MKWIDNYAFNKCEALTDVVLPQGLTTINYGAFANCKSLTRIVVPDAVTRIADNTFAGCESLSQVTIGQSVNSIGKEAFGECFALNTVYCKAVAPPIIEYSTFANYADAVLYVPAQSVQTYRNTVTWEHFGLILSTPCDVNGDGEISIADVNVLISIILSGEGVQYGDVNGDGEVSIADINAVINAIITSNPVLLGQ